MAERLVDIGFDPDLLPDLRAPRYRRPMRARPLSAGRSRGPLQYLGEMANTIVLIVAGSINPLLRTGCYFVGKLEAQGFGIAATEDVLAGYRQTIVIVDEHLLEISSIEGMVVLRAELLAQRVAIEPQIGAISAFLCKFARPIVMAPRFSPILGMLAARSEAEIVTAPCCWRAAEARRQIISLAGAKGGRCCCRPTAACAAWVCS
jgi:hypothetical protein